MKNILIINLRRIGDVYSTGHLINSLSKSLSNNVSLLVFKESAKAASNLKNLKNIFEIDRKEIITLKTNKLFSDGFALEQLFTQLQVIKNQNWDEVVNYSNDLIGSYLCSYLSKSTKKITGVHFDQQRKIVPKSDWEMLFNDILPLVNYAPLHFIDCYHKMTGITHIAEGEKIITSSDHNATAFSSISSLRNNSSTFNSTAKIVGIQLKTSDLAKDIPEEIIVELISLIKKTPELIPVLLIAPFENERKFALEINQKFNNDLAIVEADLQAVASVLINIDILVTPDTAIKHIADLTETPVLEISLGHAPFLKQGSYSEGSLILSDIIIERDFTKSKKHEIPKTNIKAQDILSSVIYFFAKTKSIRPRLSNDVTLYNCTFDQLGARYSVVAGSINTQTEIHRLMSRQLLNIIYSNNESIEIYNEITDFGSTAVMAWSKGEKISLSNIMKDILGTLRSLIQSQENRKSSKDFVLNFGKLLSHSDNNTIMQIPLMIFKTKMELINSKSFEQNAKEIEVLIYELKSNTQKTLRCLKEIEDKILVQRKDEFMNRASGHVNN